MSAGDVWKLHTPFKIYDACTHDHKSAGEPGVVEIDWIGLTCEDGVLQIVCYECDTYDGETDEYTEGGKWPCNTIIALELP